MIWLQRVRRVFALGREEQRLFAQSVLLLAGVRLLLTTTSLDTTLRLTDRLVRSREPGSGPRRMDIEPAIVAVRRASRLVPGATCLTQAIAAKTLLARRGHSSTLRLGVAKEVGDLKAHAWLEAEGRVLIGEFEDRHFTPLVQGRG